MLIKRRNQLTDIKKKKFMVGFSCLDTCWLRITKKAFDSLELYKYWSQYHNHKWIGCFDMVKESSKHCSTEKEGLICLVYSSPASWDLVALNNLMKCLLLRFLNYQKLKFF